MGVSWKNVTQPVGWTLYTSHPTRLRLSVAASNGRNFQRRGVPSLLYDSHQDLRLLTHVKGLGYFVSEINRALILLKNHVSALPLWITVCRLKRKHWTEYVCVWKWSVITEHIYVKLEKNWIVLLVWPKPDFIQTSFLLNHTQMDLTVPIQCTEEEAGNNHITTRDIVHLFVETLKPKYKSMQLNCK